ncbi:MAG TPA: alkaline shock response membrane anchor protein AmaP [Verrucomicrobia bacterium]|nr:MAG: hypothetical protein A2X46_06680 [Lentisphaerae bacterium GWF2_57_35]HBA85601.1 alkaline shock response membrane anchor protein AmaP [Verrucomicrobiota bacterium]
MKFLHALFGTLLFAVVILVGGYMVYASMDGELWRKSLDFLAAERWISLGAGVALILLAVVYLLSCFRRKSRVEFLSFENESGAVSISMNAIGDFLGKVGDEFAAVEEMKPSIQAISGAIEVTLDVKVKAGTQIPELCRMLQDRVKESITTNLGLTDIKGVRVNVQEIVSAPAASTEKRETQE